MNEKVYGYVDGEKVEIVKIYNSNCEICDHNDVDVIREDGSLDVVPDYLLKGEDGKSVRIPDELYEWREYDEDF